MERMKFWIATFFGLGNIRKAPGTLGSFIGCGLVLLIGERFFASGAMIGLLFVLGLWAVPEAERRLGSRDPGQIIIDEICGMMLALFFLPLSLSIVFTGFILFRVLDIFKPPPIRMLERLPQGWGVMGDDLFCGFVVNIALRLLIFKGFID